MNRLHVVRNRIHTHRGPASGGGGGGGGFPTWAGTAGNLTGLTTNTATTVSPGTYTGQNFVNGLNLTGVSNVTFQECRIKGIDFGFGTADGRSFTDCDIDGGEYGTGAAAGGYMRGTMLRCRIWNAAAGVSGGIGTWTDCFLGELYISGDAHGEAVLMYGDDSTFDHCTLFGQYKPGGNQTTPGGGVSAAWAMYTHGGTWGPHVNVTLQNSLLSAPNAAIGLYWGTPDSGDDPLTNCKCLNNTFRKAAGSTTSAASNGTDIVKNYFGGTGNQVTGNVYEDSGLPVIGND